MDYAESGRGTVFSVIWEKYKTNKKGGEIKLFLRQLAQSAGRYIEYETMDTDRLLECDIQAFNGNIEPMEGI